MKTFKDLIFQLHPLAVEVHSIESTTFDEVKKSRQAIMVFENGYKISVLQGTIFRSNGTDTFEAAIMRNGSVCITIDDVTEYDISDIMRQIQNLPNS